MCVCICAGVTEDQIKAAAGEGVCSMRELSREYGVATGCGQCAMLASAILDEAIQQQRAVTTESQAKQDVAFSGGEQAFA